MEPTLLLHICCATCAAFVLKKLRESYRVTALYYNPNIYPIEEYQRRFSEAKKYCQKYAIDFIELPPDQENWFAQTKGHEQDPERGDRCTICYRMRLQKTAAYAKEYGFDMFGTDLSISPHKDAQRLNMIGKELEQACGVAYLEGDFKKHGGFTQAMALSRKECFYRQNYCGCARIAYATGRLKACTIGQRGEHFHTAYTYAIIKVAIYRKDSMKTVAIIGASKDHSTFSNKAIRAYRDEGWSIFPVNPGETQLEGFPVFRTVAEIPGSIDRVSMYVRPAIGLQLIAGIIKKKPQELYLNPGTKDPNIIQQATEAGIRVVRECSILAIGRHPNEY